jgi:hypothetical protein
LIIRGVQSSAFAGPSPHVCLVEELSRDCRQRLVLRATHRLQPIERLTPRAALAAHEYAGRLVDNGLISQRGL